MINGPYSSLGVLSNAKSRSISSENQTGEKSGGGRADIPVCPDTGERTGCSRELGRGWKVKPNQYIAPGETYTVAEINESGCVQSIWMTPAGVPYRNLILRIYYDGQDLPSVECPVGDFFASAYTKFDVFAQISSLAVCVNPGNAFNCYWPMPFRKGFRMTIENRDPKESLLLFYQVNYVLQDVPEDTGYFHAQFRRTNPLEYGKVHTILDGVRGRGHYAGTYMAWGVNNNGWWGEGEIKFYLDGDIPEGEATDEAVAEHGGSRFPTICGTGTEDYFCGSYNFENKATKQYQEYTTPYAGLPHIVRPDGVYESQTRFSLYRWHIPDPIHFQEDIAVTIQALGWRSGGRYMPLQDDLSSVAYWYQALPTPAFPELPDRDFLEII
ncbi:glycoside hydrolase family 172 protein [Rubellicoccus peritrichatus]|uniref:Glycoside hydrolase family 172 protein n=1 Tax=Rubellicoccus peritrichatus TaxID=3080537 RepID=A0AAQ3LAZ1_9BACT|nr:glycoside hydrolase family 172 protein [Puniceicoccus sp. CR14]WOO40927.1 glycoside hydrolase family 172 protein [Puniceicoccus sp. CR14]